MNNGSSSTQFNIERSDDGGTTYTVIDTTDAGATGCADTTVLDGGTYWYIVAAVSQDGTDSNPSSPTGATTPLLAPTEPRGRCQRAERDGRFGRSRPLVEQPAQTATGYAIYRSTDGVNFGEEPIGTIDDPDATSYSDTFALAATQYYYEVVATEGTLSSNPSNIAVCSDRAEPFHQRSALRRSEFKLHPQPLCRRRSRRLRSDPKLEHQLGRWYDPSSCCWRSEHGDLSICVARKLPGERHRADGRRDAHGRRREGFRPRRVLHGNRRGAKADAGVRRVRRNGRPWGGRDSAPGAEPRRGRRCRAGASIWSTGEMAPDPTPTTQARPRSCIRIRQTASPTIRQSAW